MLSLDGEPSFSPCAAIESLSLHGFSCSNTVYYISGNSIVYFKSLKKVSFLLASNFAMQNLHLIKEYLLIMASLPILRCKMCIQ